MSAQRYPSASSAFSRRFDWAGFTLGFGLSGFFDGILLHQILQWHHLLSAIQSGAFGSLRVQVMADGVFHMLMYVVTAVGLWLMIRARAEFAHPAAGRRVLANFAIGFGVWHVVDAVFSHWITGIHRIRMDVAEPIWWDLGWLVLFGVIPLAVGWFLRAAARPPGDSGPGRFGVAVALIGASLVGAALNLFPVGGGPANSITVVMRPDAPPAGLFAALEGTDARVVWSDASGAVWVVASDASADLLRFYRHGAMYVSGTVMPAGCSAWVRERAPGPI